MKLLHTFVITAYKESKFLEECINSLEKQTVKSNILITTSTPNKYIEKIAKKHKIDVIINPEKRGIGYDFDFAKNVSKTELVTIAHQDDIYDSTYAEEMINAYKKQPKSIIIFPDYYELRKEGKVYKNINLNIKQVLLFLLRFHGWSNLKIIKRSALRFGDAISCPSVTFIKKYVPDILFSNDELKCNIDWYAWEQLSRKKGYFYYIHKPLMGHRIYDESTTSKIIGDNRRTIEDYYMFKKFWIKPIAKLITKVYSSSEKSNED